MKLELEHQYDAWQDIIDKEEAKSDSWYEDHEIELANKENFENKIIDVSSKLLLDKSFPEIFHLPLSKELDQLNAELNEKVVNFREEFF